MQQSGNPKIRASARLAVAILFLIGATGCGSPSEDGSDPSGAADGSGSAISLEADYAGTEELPPTEGPSLVEGANVWAVYCSANAVGCTAPAEALVEAGEVMGWDVTVADGNFGVGDGNNVAIRQAIAAKADAIVMIGIDCEASKAGLQDARDAGIVTVGLGSFDCDDTPLFTAEMQWNSKALDYGSFYESYGRAKARWLIAKTDGTANVLATDLTDSEVARRPFAAFVDEMDSKCPDCEVTEVEFSTQDMLGGAEAQKFSAAVVANPQANSVMCTLDAFCHVGNVVATTASAGREFQIMSGEGLPDTMEGIRNGQIGAVTGYDTNWMGWGVADAVNRVLRGEEQVPQGIGWQLVDADHNLPDDGGFASSVDFRSAYRKLWGVG